MHSKKIFLYICLGVLLIVSISSCKDDRLKVYPNIYNDGSSDTTNITLTHPCMLHTAADFSFIKSKLDAGAQPWTEGYTMLTSSSYAVKNYTPHPVKVLVRGDVTGTGVSAENYPNAMYDAAAAYQTALMWKFTGDTGYAGTAVRILNAWAATCDTIQANDPNQYLVAGLQGYQFANAAEIVRDYAGWDTTDFDAFKKWMVKVFYSKNLSFLRFHDGVQNCQSTFWSNWDICNMCSLLSIGILCDDKSKIAYAINFFKNGASMGNIDSAVVHMFTVDGEQMGQCQESGRDQGHCTLDVCSFGQFCQMAYNIGIDLFSYENNKVLAMCEYIAKYNVSDTTTLPYLPYINCEGELDSVISPLYRGTIRPSWELIYNHYAKIKGISCPWSQAFAEAIRPEGGGGNYGPNSGGFDQLGFGTLMYSK